MSNYRSSAPEGLAMVLVGILALAVVAVILSLVIWALVAIWGAIL